MTQRIPSSGYCTPRSLASAVHISTSSRRWRTIKSELDTFAEDGVLMAITKEKDRALQRPTAQPCRAGKYLRGCPGASSRAEHPEENTPEEDTPEPRTPKQHTTEQYIINKHIPENAPEQYTHRAVILPGQDALPHCIPGEGSLLKFPASQQCRRIWLSRRWRRACPS